MGWDKRIMRLYPRGIGMEFPAFLTTWRSEPGNLVFDFMMRPLFNKGFKPEQHAKSLLELHSAEFDKLRLLHEYKTKSIREGLNPSLPFYRKGTTKTQHTQKETDLCWGAKTMWVKSN